MPRFTAEQIYAYARQAGFSPDQATTMTAIAMAESGGDSRSHATVGEDSRGLWQINAAAHPDLAQQFDLYDPAQNAKAAFIASHGGADVSPWTTTHGGLGARYLRFKDDAQAAAAAYGDGPDHGVWTGTAGYGHPLSAGAGQGGHAAPTGTVDHAADGSAAVVVGHDAAVGAAGTGAPGTDFGIAMDDPGAGTGFGIPLDAPLAADPAGSGATVTPAGTGGTGAAATTTAATTGGTGTDHLHTFLSAANAQRGDEYIFGVMDRLDDPDPKAFDCSMLVQWSAHQAGTDLPRNAWDQYKWLHDRGMVIPVDQAIHTPGAVLFSFNSDPNGNSAPVHQHVAISTGDGKTVEALGRQYGVGSWDATPKRFQYAAVIPGISDPASAGASGGGPLPSVTTDAHGGVVVAALVDQAAPAGATPTVTAVGDPHGGDVHVTDAAPSFADRLDADPDHLDQTHPGGAPAGPVPVPALPDPGAAAPHDAHDIPDQGHFTVDANDDGLDDSLQAAHDAGHVEAHDPWAAHSDHGAG